MTTKAKLITAAALIAALIVVLAIVAIAFNAFLGARAPLGPNESLIGGTIDIASLAAGDHTLTLEAKNRSGETISDSVTFTKGSGCVPVTPYEGPTVPNVDVVGTIKSIQNTCNGTYELVLSEDDAYASDRDRNRLASDVEIRIRIQPTTNVIENQTVNNPPALDPAQIQIGDSASLALGSFAVDERILVETTDIGIHRKSTPRPFTQVSVAYSNSATIVGQAVSRISFALTDGQGEWSSVLVDQDIGNHPSLALDSRGLAHIAYYTSAGGLRRNLTYAREAHGPWSATDIDTRGSALWPAIALDQNDAAHISYFFTEDPTSNDTADLMYATNKSGSWVTETVDSAGRVGQESSIAIDSQGHVHIAYRETTTDNDRVKYATNKGGTWQTSVVEAKGGPPSLAIGNDDRVHIGYTYTIGAEQAEIHYAVQSGATWSIETVTTSTAFTGPDLALTASNQPHLMYFDTTERNLQHATKAGATWGTTVIINDIDESFTPSLAIDDDGHLHASYTNDNQQGRLEYLTNKSGQWVSSVIDESQISGVTGGNAGAGKGRSSIGVYISQ